MRKYQHCSKVLIVIISCGPSSHPNHACLDLQHRNIWYFHSVDVSEVGFVVGLLQNWWMDLEKPCYPRAHWRSCLGWSRLPAEAKTWRTEVDCLLFHLVSQNIPGLVAIASPKGFSAREQSSYSTGGEETFETFEETFQNAHWGKVKLDWACS